MSSRTAPALFSSSAWVAKLATAFDGADLSTCWQTRQCPAFARNAPRARNGIEELLRPARYFTKAGVGASRTAGWSRPHRLPQGCRSAGRPTPTSPWRCPPPPSQAGTQCPRPRRASTGGGGLPCHSSLPGTTNSPKRIDHQPRRRRAPAK